MPSKSIKNDDKPNILFILVDELRFPSVFPQGIHNAAEFLNKYMPNVYKLWQKGVKFSNYHTAANACTPARGTLITGLYSQQTWLCCTLTNDPTVYNGQTQPLSNAPVLDPRFPTYGKLLREAGYLTPYIGKWHVSELQQGEPGNGIDEYGFDELLWPDPSGFNLQGTVGYHGPSLNTGTFLNDHDIAQAAVGWLTNKSQRLQNSKQPWCLTVGFVNPHDREFFWAGTEYEHYNYLMKQKSPPAMLLYGQDNNTGGGPPVPDKDNPLKDPPEIEGNPSVPDNWESATQMEKHKPATQSLFRKFQAMSFGGVSDDPDEKGYNCEPFPGTDPISEKFEIGTAPYSYWKRGLDSYIQIMGKVDVQIGSVVDALPEDVAKNTVIIFASDHGEYNGAHGFLSGKIGSVYKEAFNIPLIVVDNRDSEKKITDHENTLRTGLVSSVDFLRMIVSIGNGGKDNWMEENEIYKSLYKKRHDMLPMLKSADAPGREYVLLVSDELIPGIFNFNDSTLHIIGLQTKLGKLGAYAKWVDNSAEINWDASSFEWEYYDYSEGDTSELHNLRNDPMAKIMVKLLFEEIVPNELRAPLPGSIGDKDSLKDAGKKARMLYLEFQIMASHYIRTQLSKAIRSKREEASEEPVAGAWLAFGKSF